MDMNSCTAPEGAKKCECFGQRHAAIEIGYDRYLRWKW